MGRPARRARGPRDGRGELARARRLPAGGAAARPGGPRRARSTSLWSRPGSCWRARVPDGPPPRAASPGRQLPGARRPRRGATAGGSSRTASSAASSCRRAATARVAEPDGPVLPASPEADEGGDWPGNSSPAFQGPARWSPGRSPASRDGPRRCPRTFSAAFSSSAQARSGASGRRLLPVMPKSTLAGRRVVQSMKAGLNSSRSAIGSWSRGTVAMNRLLKSRLSNSTRRREWRSSMSSGVASSDSTLKIGTTVARSGMWAFTSTAPGSTALRPSRPARARPRRRPRRRIPRPARR